MWLVEEAKKNMPVELDFLNEGRNAEKVAVMLAHFPWLKVHTHTRCYSAGVYSIFFLVVYLSTVYFPILLLASVECGLV